MFCIALKRNGNLCRNYALLETQNDGSLTRACMCHVHKDSYTNQERLKQRWLHTRLTTGTAMYLQNDPSRRIHVEECLQHKIVEIQKEDIQSIQLLGNLGIDGRRWAYFLYVCSLHVEGFSPTWNLPLWKACVRQFWIWTQSVGPVSIDWEKICELICVKGDLRLWYLGMSTYPDHQDGYTEDDFYRFLDTCAKRPEWSEEFLLEPLDQIEARLAELGEPKNLAMTVLKSERFLRWRLFQKELLREECRFRIFEYKEELLNVGWSPSRILGWCVDWEETKGILSRWSGLADKN